MMQRDRKTKQKKQGYHSKKSGDGPVFTSCFHGRKYRWNVPVPRHRHQTESGRSSRPGFFVALGFELAAGGWQGLIYSSFQLPFLCLYCAVSINSPLLSTSFFCKRTLSATKIRVVTRFFRVTALFCCSKFLPIAAHSAGVLCPSAHVGGLFFACWLGGGSFFAYSSIFLSSMQLSLILP